MVQLFSYLLKAVKKPIRKHLRGTFIDSLRLTVQGGHGGNGLAKYGGIGGQGGCVYFVAKDNVTLRNLEKKWKDKRIAASVGEDSSKVRILGKRGLDTCVEVPVGVQVLDEKGQKVLADLNANDATFIAAGGGIGGCSGTNFLGKPGEHHTISLDLKLIADVGLVGFPNAGKSTLLKAISNAKPRIAEYPFTTIRPQIGVVDYPDLRRITIADLPGLIEGAHANFGMGHKFLKHIERTRLLLLIVDIFGFRLSAKHEQRNCLENIYSLNRELELYDESLLDKPTVLLINKMDKDGAQNIFANLKSSLENLENALDKCPEHLRPQKLFNFERIITISAKNEARIQKVKKELRLVLDQLAEKELMDKEVKIREMLLAKVGERGPKVT